jgi:hypothetical protein
MVRLGVELDVVAALALAGVEKPEQPFNMKRQDKSEIRPADFQITK